MIDASLLKSNHMLAGLPSAERDRLMPQLLLVSLRLGDVVYESGAVLRHLYFPTTCVVSLLFVAYLFVCTPVLNTMTRTQEYEADVFGLNTARQPDGFAQIAIKLSEYRKLDPGKWEEMIFFDHPSGHTRIFTAMRWKAENLPGSAGATTPSASSASGNP